MYKVQGTRYKVQGTRCNQENETRGEARRGKERQGEEMRGERRGEEERRGEKRRGEDIMNDCEWRTKSQVQGKRGNWERREERGKC